MSCPWDTAELSALLDGELAEPQAGQVRKHLDRCPECRHTYSQLEQARSAFYSTQPEAVSADFTRRVVEAVGVAEGGGRARVRWLAGVAAIAAVVVLYVAWPLESGQQLVADRARGTSRPVAVVAPPSVDPCGVPMRCVDLDISMRPGARTGEETPGLRLALNSPGMM